MSTESDIATSEPPASTGFLLPRFPARWVVESATAERVFARLLWLLVPLQYYVVTNIGRGVFRRRLGSGRNLVVGVGRRHLPS
jgi:hypothetical protein